VLRNLTSQRIIDNFIQEHFYSWALIGVAKNWTFSVCSFIYLLIYFLLYFSNTCKSV